MSIFGHHPPYQRTHSCPTLICNVPCNPFLDRMRPTGFEMKIMERVDPSEIIERSSILGNRTNQNLV